MREEENEVVAHMIDVDPILFLNCSKRELLYSGICCVLTALLVFFVLFLLLGLHPKRYIILPLLGLFLGVPCSYFVARRIGRVKQGKPHLYIRHKFAIFLSRWQESGYFTHTGVLAIGRTYKTEPNK